MVPADLRQLRGAGANASTGQKGADVPDPRWRPVAGESMMAAGHEVVAPVEEGRCTP